MTEGDIIGLPSLEDGTTRFVPVDWVVKASNEPVVLFLVLLSLLVLAFPYLLELV